jgi:hypothetical protein
MFIEPWHLLTNLCNSTVIEIYGDIIRVSHGFDGCQMLEYIAVIKGPHNKKFTSAMLFGVWCNGWLGMVHEYKESMA